MTGRRKRKNQDLGIRSIWINLEKHELPLTAACGGQGASGDQTPHSVLAVEQERRGVDQGPHQILGGQDARRSRGYLGHLRRQTLVFLILS